MYSGDINTFGKESKGVFIGKKYARDDSTITPGPGAYSARVDIVKGNSQSMRLGSA
jgi:hypothetical protein